MQEFMKNVVVMDHPLIAHKITHLCDVTTKTKEFREIVSEIAMLMGYEAFRDLQTTEVEIQAPLSKFMSPVINDKIAIVPILRAGLGMVDGLTALFPNAQIGHIGLYRDEQTLEPHEYYCKLPMDCVDGQCIVVDPALATGGSRNTTAVGSCFLRQCPLCPGWPPGFFPVFSLLFVIFLRRMVLEEGMEEFSWPWFSWAFRRRFFPFSSSSCVSAS